MDDPRFHDLVQTFAPGAALVRAYPLTGGISARVTALELVYPDGTESKVVVRQHGQFDLAQNPHIAADEFRLLSILQAAGVAVPTPIHVDFETFETPVIAAQFVEGEPDFAPANLSNHLRQLADQLARIHAVETSAHDLSFLRHLKPSIDAKLASPPENPDESLSETRIRDALSAIYPSVPQNPPTLLHGDFWLGNVLWKEGALSAVVDWENAILGDPLADLANTRMEMIWAFGIDSMHEFTTNYLALTALDTSAMPVWDLIAALRPAGRLSTWGLPPDVESVMRERHLIFVEQALTNLSIS